MIPTALLPIAEEEFLTVQDKENNSEDGIDEDSEINHDRNDKRRERQ